MGLGGVSPLARRIPSPHERSERRGGGGGGGPRTLRPRGGLENPPPPQPLPAAIAGGRGARTVRALFCAQHRASSSDLSPRSAALLFVSAWAPPVPFSVSPKGNGAPGGARVCEAPRWQPGVTPDCLRNL